MMDRCAAMREAMHEPELRAKLFAGSFGMRMQAHRVLTDGRASRYPYPSQLGSRVKNPYLTSGISDNLMEFNAVIVKGSEAAVRQLQILQQIVDRQMESQERLWPLTMPPAPVYKDDLDFLSYNCSRPDQKDFYHYLVGKYGIKSLLMGGVHVGYGLDKQLLEEIYRRFYLDKYRRQADFQNHLYFKLAQGFYRWQWLFTYLFGASPVLANPLKGMPDNLAFPVRSLRSSDFGYTNFPSETITYSSLGAQLDQLKRFVAEGKFYSLHEFYGPVRLKSRGANSDDLIAHGTERLEFRAFDLDPLSRAGISNDTLNFLEVFLAYWLVADQEADLTEADEKNQAVALQHPHQEFDWTKERGLALLDDLDAFVAKYGAPKEYQAALLFARRRLEDPRLTIGGQLIDKADPDGGLLSYGLKIANSHHDWYKSMAYPLQPTIATYPAPAQELIKAAIELGIKAKVTQNSFALILGDHQEQYAANQAFDLTNGAKQAVLAAFPEQVNYTDQVDQVQV